jgi:hypothetical protein
VLRAQASNLLGQAEALVGLTSEDEFLQKSVKELAMLENNEMLAKSPEEFTKANLRIQEIAPKIKALIGGLTCDKKEKFDKKAEKKTNRAFLNHFNKLQKELDELTANMPD